MSSCPGFSIPPPPCATTDRLRPTGVPQQMRAGLPAHVHWSLTTLSSDASTFRGPEGADLREKWSCLQRKFCLPRKGRSQAVFRLCENTSLPQAAHPYRRLIPSLTRLKITSLVSTFKRVARNYTGQAEDHVGGSAR